MYIKALILRGFKTFADQTELEFTENARITAIVGPNGCGKSNLMDATRWVLGEDNPRELRVAALSDIIFAGTLTRKPLSMAEITLVFDNSAGRLAIPFTEVAIKRRTFREGESEFFINKNKCRLKDIKDLLMDTGLGEGTYSIITQGRVDAILSSKGEERRAVFEEAAGINKYKTRKEAAEKKLIAAEQNLLRISDLKIEINEQLLTLEEQARKAREYLDLQALLKNEDIGLSRRLLEQIMEKKKQVSEELGKIKQEAEVQKAAEAQDDQELQALKESHKKIENEIDGILVALDQEKDRLRDLEFDQRLIQNDIQREEKNLKVLAEKEIELGEKSAENQSNLEQEKGEINFSEIPEADLFRELVQNSSKLIELLSSILAALGQENKLSLTLAESNQKEESYKLRLEMLREEISELQGDKERLNLAIQDYQAQLANIGSKIESAKNEQVAAATLSQKRKEKEELYQKISSLEDKIRNEGQLERKKLNEETSLEISLAKLEGEMTGICEKISLEYNLSLDEIMLFPYQIANVAKAKKEVEDKKARLRSLEPVNLLAIEEFDKAKERLSFIEAQLQDLNSARESLRNLIIELDLKAEQTFQETMQQISTIFSEVFSKLFQGGEAKIALTPGVPALQAEIEISVRPSGRKWLPLPLLSGGERSLSAIAILFSLLKIRPSPFCFLDEVDAALDDANIGRFAEMLKDFSGHSQIIVITHNKRTMAVADNIYGVTMEEPGTSRLLSMKLAEAVA
jgi:chromosome segregation protein